MTVQFLTDEPSTWQSVLEPLSLEGHEVRISLTDTDGLDALSNEVADVIVLDLHRPGHDSIETCRSLRHRGDRTPVLILGSGKSIPDMVEGLDAGADDYLPRPFAPAELRARLRALQRRTGHAADATLLHYEDLTLDVTTGRCCRGRHPLDHLTATESRLIELFLRNPTLTLTRARIIRELWGNDPNRESEHLDFYIGSLRRKTEADGEPRLIQTIRGDGFALRSRCWNETGSDNRDRPTNATQGPVAI